MNKKLWSAFGLTVVLSTQCIYADETTFNQLPTEITVVQDREEDTTLDDMSDFELITNNEVKEELNSESNNVSDKTQLEENVTLEDHTTLNNNTLPSEEDVNSDEFVVPEGTEPVVEEGLPSQSEPTVEDEIEQETQPETVPQSEQSLENKVILTLDSKTAIVDGQKEALITPPKIVDGTTLLPMRFVAEKVVGATILWDQPTKTVTMIKGDRTVSVTIDSKTALVDGVPTELRVAPIIENNTTLVPLRFLSENFDVKVDYNAAERRITLDKSEQQAPVVIPNEAPVAAFSFPGSYIAGQVVTPVDASYDPDGDHIVSYLWAVVEDGKTTTTSNLSDIFKTPRAGTHKIGLKVKDSRGAWSDWTYETVYIAPNEAPVLTGLTPSKSSFAQGEKISFLPYTYENESWESVKDVKWTYRRAYEPANKAALGKPEKLFAEGDYIISLNIEDAYGNRSNTFETTVHISDHVMETELNYKFSNQLIGEWIDNFNNMNYLGFKQVDAVHKNYDYGTLIMSDSPEEVKGQGILYRDSINGKGRLLIHHINAVDSSEKQRLAFIVENPTTEPITVTLYNKAIKGPATDILRVGQLCLVDYLGGKIPPETIELQPGERQYIYNKNWSTHACVSAHIDVETTGEARFTVANMGVNDTLENLDNMYYFPADGVHYSGTYDKTGIHFTFNLDGNEPERLSLGVVNSNEWLIGYDERTGQPVANTGNFGVSYYMTVTAEEDMGVILNNRGGLYQGAVKWNDTVLSIPAKGTFSGTTSKAVVLGVIKKGETVTIEYLLPNGSAAPTLIGFIPKHLW